MKFGVRKLESWGYLPDGEEIMPLALFVFDTIPPRDRQTDGRTDTLLCLLRALAWHREGKNRQMEKMPKESNFNPSS